MSNISFRYRLSTKRDDDGETTVWETTRFKALNVLVQENRQFHDEQEVQMPRLHSTLTADQRNPDRGVALTMQPWLSSDLDQDDTRSPASLRVRWAPMPDELENLMHQLRLRRCLNRFKILSISGQRANTRVRTGQDAVDANV